MKDFTEIVVVLDRSGSMESRRDDVIGGYNAFVQEQKLAGPNAAITLVTFDDQSIDTVQEHTPVLNLPSLNRDGYIPRGGTPLLDTLGKVINETGDYLRNLSEGQRPDKVVVVVITDGYENASRKFTKEQISGMIKRQEKDYNWKFVYLGANQDAFAEAAHLNINVQRAATFNPSRFVYSSGITGSNVASYRTSGQAAALNYSKSQLDNMVADDEDDVLITNTAGGK